jgi:hypothetical protein
MYRMFKINLQSRNVQAICKPYEWYSKIYKITCSDNDSMKQLSPAEALPFWAATETQHSCVRAPPPRLRSLLANLSASLCSRNSRLARLWGRVDSV